MDKYIKTIENDEVIKLISPFLKDKKAFIVGGFIRDVLTDKKSPDRDLIICDCDVKSFSKKLADKINGYYIELDIKNNIYRIVLQDKINYLDITCPIENDFEKDIKRRDLTINAIAYDINNKKFIDIVGGIKDIKEKNIKGICVQNFKDDPLRLLRVFRFYSKTGFKIDNELLEISKKYCKEITKPAKERLTVELLKMFEGKFCDKALIKLYKTGLLEEIFPIYKEVKKIPPNSHHHLDLIHHLIETVYQIQNIYENAQDEVKKHLDTIKYGGVKELAFLKLAGFLHDIGKPSCWTIEEETGRHRFIRHDSIGEKLVQPILKELKFSKKQIEYIKSLIKYHIYPSSLVSTPDVSEKAFLKFYRKMDKLVIDVIILAMADRLSARGEKITDEMVKNNIDNLTKLLNIYLEQQNNIKPIEKLLNGNDIMQLLNLEQGPELGKIIKSLQEAQNESIVNTKEEAIEFVKSQFFQTK